MSSSNQGGGGGTGSSHNDSARGLGQILQSLSHDHGILGRIIDFLEDLLGHRGGGADCGPPPAHHDHDPIALNDMLSAVAQNSGARVITASQLLANDRDPDNNSHTPNAGLKIVAVDDAHGGSVSLDKHTGQITFTPAHGFHGTASFEYTITDPQGHTDTAVVSFAVNQTAGNAPPTLALGASTVAFTSGQADLVLANTATVGDDHNALTKLVIDLHASGGLNSGETIVSSEQAALQAQGYHFTHTVTATDDVLTIDAPAGHPQTAATFTDIVDHIAYHNGVSDFSFNASDRTVSFTLSDDQGGIAMAQKAIAMQANVSDASGPVDFTGGDHNDTITIVNGGGTIDAGGGDDTIVFQAGAGDGTTVDGGDGANSFVFNASASGGGFALGDDGAGGISGVADADGFDLTNIQSVTFNLVGGGDTVDTSTLTAPIDVVINTGTGGSETLNLGAAHETVKFAGQFGNDNSVEGFTTGGEDHIVVDINNPSDASQYDIAAEGSDAVINIHDGHGVTGSITLTGVSSSSVHVGTELLLV